MIASKCLLHGLVALVFLHIAQSSVLEPVLSQWSGYYLKVMPTAPPICFSKIYSTITPPWIEIVILFVLIVLLSFALFVHPSSFTEWRRNLQRNHRCSVILSLYRCSLEPVATVHLITITKLEFTKHLHQCVRELVKNHPSSGYKVCSFFSLSFIYRTQHDKPFNWLWLQNSHMRDQ